MTKFARMTIAVVLLGACSDPGVETAGKQQATQNDTRYIVAFATPAGPQALAAAGAKVELVLGPQNAVAARIPAAALQGLQHNPNIAYVEEDVKRTPFATGNPNSGEVAPYGITMVQADQLAYQGGIKVCIIDSGYTADHEDATPNVTGYNGNLAWDDDQDGHGTHVGGTIAAMGGNGKGVVGVNSNGAIELYIVRVFGDDGSWAYSSSLVDAANRCAAAGAKVINMSLGGSFKSRTEERTFADLYAAGVLSIAAAGNDGNTRKSYPASYDSVVSVAALDANKQVADFSQQNDQVEVAAPGVNVLSTVPTGHGSWSEVVAGSTGYEANAMEGSPSGSISANLVDCSLGTSTCAGASGAVCLIERGDVSFADKVLACEDGGGVAAIIYNNTTGPLNGTLGGVATTIPSVGVSDVDGATLSGQLGTSVTVSITTSNYAFYDGTSMATPHVVGVAALVWSYFPELGPAEIRAALQQTAEDLGAAGKDTAYGYGLVQAKAAVDALTACTADNSCGGGGGGGGGDTGGSTGGGKGGGKGGGGKKP